MRRSLVAASAAAGITLVPACVVCRRLRNDKYARDPRWASTARDEEYARLFPPGGKWWPAHLQERVVEVADGE